MSAPRESATLSGPSTTVRTLPIYVGGKWVDSSATATFDVYNPAKNELLARTPLGGAADVDRAVQAALEGVPGLARDAAGQPRAAPVQVKELFEKTFDDLARTCTIEHGKTLDESRSSVRRAIDNVEVAIGIPITMQGRSLEDIATGIDCYTYRQPLGVFAAITPFNFPAMVPMWFLPHAIACGNTFIVKPSERVPLSQQRIFELLHECRLARGRREPGARRARTRWTRSSITRASPACRSSAARRSRTTSTSAPPRRASACRRWAAPRTSCSSCRTPTWTRAAQVTHRVVLRLRRRALPREQRRAGRGRARTTSWSSSSWPRRRRSSVGDGLEPGVTMGPVITAGAPREGARLHREGHRRGRHAGARRPRLQGREESRAATSSGPRCSRTSSRTW